jgi:hypothetical protein
LSDVYRLWLLGFGRWRQRRLGEYRRLRRGRRVWRQSGAIDTMTCAVCDAAAKCCTAAIGLSSCNAYSTSGCEKDMDPADQAEVINACAVEYDATKGTPGCQ